MTRSVVYFFVALLFVLAGRILLDLDGDVLQTFGTVLIMTGGQVVVRGWLGPKP